MAKETLAMREFYKILELRFKNKVSVRIGLDSPNSRKSNTDYALIDLLKKPRASY